MGKSHMKRIAAPRTWPLLRKKSMFVTRPNPGKVQELCLPLNFILKELIGVTQSTVQSKVLLNDRRVVVGGKIRRDIKFPVGLYEVVTINPDNVSYRITIGHNGKLQAIKVTEKEDETLQQITSKKLVKKGKYQVGFLSGLNVTVDKANEYAVGDTVVLKGDKIEKHIPFKIGMTAQFIGGRHIGAIGAIESIDGQIIVANIKGTPTETLKKYAFVVGEKSEELKIHE